MIKEVLALGPNELRASARSPFPVLYVVDKGG